MTPHDHLLSEFIDDWNAGRRPRVLDVLQRVPEGPQRDALAEELALWIEMAPTPAHDEAARERIRAEPSVRALLDRAGELGAWPTMLPELRARRDLDVRGLAHRVAERCGLGERDRDRAARYLERLESGDLEPTRVSRRLLDVLGGILGISGETLGAAGGLRAAAAPGGVLFRGEPGTAYDVEAVSLAAFASPPDELDEVDRLFTGGPDA